MKLRIKGNSIRLRLSQTEVDQVGEGNIVQEEVPFGNTCFTYALKPVSHHQAITASYQNNQMLVCIPHQQVQLWAKTDQVSIEEQIEVGTGCTLHLLIEKDFQCLHKRPNEDESDHFPNPAAIRQ